MLREPYTSCLVSSECIALWNRWKELEKLHHIQIPEYTLAESDNFPGIDLLFLTSSAHDEIESVAKAILKHISIFDVHKYTVAFMPEKKKDGMDLMGQLLGRYVEFVKFQSLDITCVPLEYDLMSMELPNFQRSVALANREEKALLLDTVTQALGNIEQNYMPIRNLQAKGQLSCEIIRSLKEGFRLGCFNVEHTSF